MQDADLFGNPISQYVDYDEYMQSAAWQRKRQQVITRSGNRCERCGKSRYIAALDVHHKTYVRLGNELLSDLEALCRDCHNIADTQREWQNKTAAKEKSLEVVHRIEIDTGRGGFDTWAAVVFGDNWRDHYTFAEVLKHFTRSRAMPDPMKYNPWTPGAFSATLESDRVQPEL